MCEEREWTAKRSMCQVLDSRCLSCDSLESPWPQIALFTVRGISPRSHSFLHQHDTDTQRERYTLAARRAGEILHVLTPCESEACSQAVFLLCNRLAVPQLIPGSESQRHKKRKRNIVMHSPPSFFFSQEKIPSLGSRAAPVEETHTHRHMHVSIRTTSSTGEGRKRREEKADVCAGMRTAGGGRGHVVFRFKIQKRLDRHSISGGRGKKGMGSLF